MKSCHRFFLAHITARIHRRIASLAAVFFTASFLFSSQHGYAQSRMYLSNDDHTDYMWSASDSKYDTLFVNMIDAWMANNNATNGSPADYQTKFDCDGSYWAWAYSQHRTAAQFQNLMNQVKSGRIVIPINPLIVTYGCVPAEATIRGMYYAGELQRNYGIPMELAIEMENQVLPLGLASLWAGSGAKYSWRGVCNCATKIPGLSSPREKEIYWYKGLDNQQVLMKWYNFQTDSYNLGGYAETRDPDSAVYFLTNKVNTPSYNYNIGAAFGVGWDDLETLTDILAPSAQANSNSSRRVIVSNEVDFFKDFDSTYGATLPALTQTYGNEWEDACASLAETSAAVKRSLEQLRAAEAMATIVARTNPSFATSLDSLRRVAWMSLGLYWEHDFGGNSPNVTNADRAAWEIRMQQAFSDYVTQLYTLAKSNLANQIALNSTNARFMVFNSLSWTRTDYADFPYSGSTSIKVVDVTTGLQVPFQFVTSNSVQYLRILAAGVPSLGYKVFEIQAGTGNTFPNTGTVDNTNQKINNDYFTVTFTKQGVITSLIDKKNGNKELVNTTSSTDFVNNLGRNTTYEGSSNSNGSFSVQSNGPVSLTVTINSTGLISHTTNLTVFKGIPRIEIDNNESENFGNDSLYTTFSFNTSTISSPTIWHEENGAVINARKVSSGGHYANQQARYDWLTLNHFAAVSNNGNYGVTLSNQDCYFMQTGKSTPTSLDENTAKLNVLVAGKVDNLGMDNQGNATSFNQSFAINSYAGYTAANSMKRALEHQNNFVTAAVTNKTGFLPFNDYSFLNISDSNTLVWALKPAETGMDVGGLIVRAWNLTNAATTPHIDFNDNIQVAYKSTHIETDISPATYSGTALSASFNANQLVTYRVSLTPTSGALSIGITDFTGIKQNNLNLISWKEDSGSSIAFFILQRSADGNSFGPVDTASGSSSIPYTYSDSVDPTIPYYYRLEIVGPNGNFVFSDIILIQADASSKNILLYPNPVQDRLNFNLVSDKKERYDVWIDDMGGQVVMKLGTPLFEIGNNYYSINTSTLPVGVYAITVSGPNTKYVRKFVKH